MHHHKTTEHWIRVSGWWQAAWKLARCHVPSHSGWVGCGLSCFIVMGVVKETYKKHIRSIYLFINDHYSRECKQTHSCKLLQVFQNWLEPSETLSKRRVVSWKTNGVMKDFEMTNSPPQNPKRRTRGNWSTNGWWCRLGGLLLLKMSKQFIPFFKKVRNSQSCNFLRGISLPSKAKFFTSHRHKS